MAHIFADSLAREIATREVLGHQSFYKHFSSPAEAIAFAKRASISKTDAPTDWARMATPRWAGLGGQSFEDFYSTGLARDALQAFNRAKAKLEVTHSLGGASRPSVAGGAWVMPLVIQGNPLPARLKLRAKLPPKNVIVSFGKLASSADHEQVAITAAKIARALWDYQMAGGAVSLMIRSIAYESWGGKPPMMLLEVSVPLSSEAAIATAISAPFARACVFCIESGMLSGSMLPIGPQLPGEISVQGVRHLDDEELKKAGIE